MAMFAFQHGFCQKFHPPNMQNMSAFWILLDQKAESLVQLEDPGLVSKGIHQLVQKVWRV